MATKKVPTPSELQIALDNRAFELQLFWQRSNYFLVLMTALGIGAFTVKDRLFAALVAFFAAVCSYLWFKTNLGSKFWQESWEVEVTILAHELGVRSFEKTTKEVTDQVTNALGVGRPSDASWFKLWINRQIVTKPSVTNHMILLSLLSVLFWAFVALVIGAQGVSDFCHRQGGCSF